MEDPFETVWAPVGPSRTHTTRSTRRHFTGEQFLEAFLNPPERCCATHEQPDCLCDVDVSKTAGMTWDKVPPELYNVETREDLVVAAANLWLNLDVVVPSSRVVQKLEWTSDPEVVERVKQAVKDGCTLDRLEKEYHVHLESHMLALMRRAVGREPPSPLNMEMVRELHAEGMSLVQIKDRIRAIDGVSFHPTTISKALKRMGLKPHGRKSKTAKGTPHGYKRDSGLTHKEWREKHGAST